MSRQIVLDTETTGLSAEGGDRIIELGCVELFARKLTGNNLHFYFNPERDSHEDALKVHGISNEFLRDKPKFAQLTDEILATAMAAQRGGSTLVYDVDDFGDALRLANRQQQQVGGLDAQAVGTQANLANGFLTRDI